MARLLEEVRSSVTQFSGMKSYAASSSVICFGGGIGLGIGNFDVVLVVRRLEEHGSKLVGLVRWPVENRGAGLAVAVGSSVSPEGLPVRGAG